MALKIALIIALMVAGIVLLPLELVVVSFGLLTILSVVMFAIAIWLGFTISMALGVGLIVAAAVGTPAFFFIFVRVLRNTRWGKGVFLMRALEKPGAATPEKELQQTLIGRYAVAETQLRPSGAIRIEGKRLIARAEGGIIQAGQRVKVIAADGMDVVVRAAPESPESQKP